MRRFLITLIFAVLASPALAQFFHGDELREMCSDKSEVGTAYAAGAIDAAFFYQQLRGVKNRICIPAGVKTDQVRDVACQFVEDHPEKRHWNAADLVAESAALAWPCP